jgi:hypothetical protein
MGDKIDPGKNRISLLYGNLLMIYGRKGGILVEI